MFAALARPRHRAPAAFFAPAGGGSGGPAMYSKGYFICVCRNVLFVKWSRCCARADGGCV